MIIIIIILFIYFIYKCYLVVENFDTTDWYNIVNNIKYNQEEIYYNDNLSINNFIKYIKNITKNKNITSQKFFISTIDKDKMYIVEVENFDNNKLTKILLINIIIENKKIKIKDINIRDTIKFPYKSYNQIENNNFEFPVDDDKQIKFKWLENPKYQNVLIPDNNLEQKINSEKKFKQNIKEDIKKAWEIANNYVDNRSHFLNNGKCFKTNIKGIDNKESCEKNYGIWDIPCNHNTDCPYYIISKNNKYNKGGCIMGYCQFPKEIKRVGYRKLLNRELNRINSLKNINKIIEEDIALCYCENEEIQTFECCNSKIKNYVF